MEAFIYSSFTRAVKEKEKTFENRIIDRHTLHDILFKPQKELDSIIMLLHELDANQNIDSAIRFMAREILDNQFIENKDGRRANGGLDEKMSLIAAEKVWAEIKAISAYIVDNRLG